MDKKRTTRELLKAAGMMSAAVMCPCIIAFGLGMAQAGPTAGGEAACTTAMLDTIALATPSFTANQDIQVISEKKQEETVPELKEEIQTVSPRKRAELMAKVKHLSDYGKDEEINPDYRQIGYVYTEEMYYKLTGATKLPDNWTEQMGTLIRDIIKEENSFVETMQTDDGNAQTQWNPEDLIDFSLYQTGTFTEKMPAAGSLAAVQAALRRIGYPYSQARRDSGIAFDCSSLVYWSYLDTGVNIDPVGGHTAASIAQYLESTGKGISGGDLMPGDLIFYSYKKNGRYKNISHVAMVAENGMMVHASSSKKMVVMTGVSLDRVVAICRPLPDVVPAVPEESQEETVVDTDLILEWSGNQEEENLPENQETQDAGAADVQESMEGQENIEVLED